MNWFQFRSFLIEQLEQFRISQNSKNFEDLVDLSESVVVHSMMDRSSHQVPHSEQFHDLHPDRRFNYRGLGEMYVSAWIREVKATPVKIAAVGTALGFSNFSWNTVLGSVRAVPTALFISQLPRNMLLWNMYFDDITSGRFPGTDESFFV
jgi:hypothetical protein